MPDRRCEVVLYTDQHDLAFWQLGHGGALEVVELWARRTRELSRRGDVGYVLIFENRGPEVGATIAHPHGQIYAYPEIPPVPLAEIVDGVSRSRRWTIPTPCPPVATGRPGYPRPPSGPMSSFWRPQAHGDPSTTREPISTAWPTSWSMCWPDWTSSPRAMPYMLWIHQLPADDRVSGGPPVHVHIAPYLRAPGTARYVAAAELGAGIYFDPVDPASAAGDLRSMAGSFP
ncbi:MAG: hypothetical protein R2789_02930 [Microthrixaceae bacterium]